jgi:nitroreductase
MSLAREIVARFAKFLWKFFSELVDLPRPPPATVWAGGIDLERFMEAILSRHSVREFKSGEISDDTLKLLVHAGLAAPSAMHSSPCHFIVVSDRKLLDGVAKIHPYAQMSLEASAGILVCGEPSREAEGFRYLFDQNCAAATENILVAVSSLKLGAVWVSVHPDKSHVEKFSQYFGLPDGIVPFAWLPIGIPHTPPAVDDRFDASRMHRNGW